jgi:hypothetical protein
MAGGGQSVYSGQNLSVGGGAAAFSLSDFTGGGWNNLRVAYIFRQQGPNDFGLSGSTAAHSQALKASSDLSLNSVFTKVLAYYTSLTRTIGTSQLDSNNGAAKVIASEGFVDSYFRQMSATAAGSFATRLDTLSGHANNGEISLAGFDGVWGGANGAMQYVEQAIRWYTGATLSEGTVTMLVRTYEDGHSEISASAVPVPPSVLLLGSGLLGLIGIRRKSTGLAA